MKRQKRDGEHPSNGGVNPAGPLAPVGKSETQDFGGAAQDRKSFVGRESGNGLSVWRYQRNFWAILG